MWALYTDRKFTIYNFSFENEWKLLWFSDSFSVRGMAAEEKEVAKWHMLGLPAKRLHKSFISGWDPQEACTGRTFPSLFLICFVGWKLCQWVTEGKGGANYYSGGFGANPCKNESRYHYCIITVMQPVVKNTGPNSKHLYLPVFLANRLCSL